MTLSRAGSGPGTRRSWLAPVLAGLAGLMLLALAIHFLPRLIYRQVGYLALGKQAGRLDANDLAAVRGLLGGQKARVALVLQPKRQPRDILFGVAGGKALPAYRSSPCGLFPPLFTGWQKTDFCPKPRKMGVRTQSLTLGCLSFGPRNRQGKAFGSVGATTPSGWAKTS